MTTSYIIIGVQIDGRQEFDVVSGSKQLEETFGCQQFIRLKKIKIPRRLISKPLSLREILQILTSLARLLENGLSIYDAVNLLIHDSSKLIYRYVYLSLRQALKEGVPLSDALESLAPLVPEFLISMLRASEKSGQFLSGIQELEQFYLERVKRQDQLRKLLRYPKIVLGFSFIFGVGILAFVVPMFHNIYRLQGDNLPLLTRGLVYLSTSIRNMPFIYLGSAGSLFFGYRWLVQKYHNFYFVKRALHWILKGRVRNQWFFSHAMSILLKNGMDLLESLSVVGESSSEDVQEKAVYLKELLKKGVGLSDALKEVGGFSEIFYYSILSAEGVGKLYLGFEQVCGYLKRKNEERFQMMSRLIEPLVMILLGGIVFVLLLGIYLPIFDMGNYIS